MLLNNHDLQVPCFTLEFLSNNRNSNVESCKIIKFCKDNKYTLFVYIFSEMLQIKVQYINAFKIGSHFLLAFFMDIFQNFSFKPCDKIAQMKNTSRRNPWPHTSLCIAGSNQNILCCSYMNENRCL
jgi:hypothetical protein